MPYEIFCQSVQGSSHIKNDMPCEDSGKVVSTDICKIFALGDGHGDSNCPRSKIGSQYICDITIQELECFASDVYAQDWIHHLFDKVEAEHLVNQLITSIFGKWSCAVNDEFARNPLTEKEEAEAVEYIERYKQGQRIEHIYGTTLIAGLLTKEYLLLLQQGDGRCVVFNEDGSASQPIPWDDRCFANVTTSVCDVDAIASCRYHIIDLSTNKIIACVAGSDGVEDSFNSMDKMHVYYRNLLKIACENGTESLESYLEESLPSFSANGSGDDTTICGVIDADLFKAKLDVMEQENELIMIKDEISRAQERIDSMSNKLAFLKKKYDDACADYSAIEARYSVLEDKYKSIKDDMQNDVEARTFFEESNENAFENAFEVLMRLKRCLLSTSSVDCLSKSLDKLERKMEALKEDLEKSKVSKEACEAEYLPYKEKYDGYIKIKEDAIIRMSELNGSNS